MKKIIIANWKMNPKTSLEAKKLFEVLKRVKTRHSLVVCPPFPFLSFAKGLILGAQDCFWESKGAFTSQVSASMLKSLSVRYVILGHSEKRALGETSETVSLKLKAALEAGLRPVLCVGEKQKDKAFQTVEEQLFESLKGIQKNNLSKVIIAYEPVWAIGTKNPCSENDALTMILFLRKLISKKYSKSLSKKIRILYGGSVEASNAKNYFNSEWVNGLLVGGASLDMKEFGEILKI